MKRQNKRIKLRQFLLLLSMAFSTAVIAQKTDVRGIVISAEDNQPLIGVSIIEKGTRNGVVTNLDGEFSIAVSSANAVLQFSMIGM